MNQQAHSAVKQPQKEGSKSQDNLRADKRKPEPGKSIRLRPDQILELLPQRIGYPRRNVRTRSIHIGQKALSPSEACLLYLELCNPAEYWLKETTIDALELLADRMPFDPVKDYLDTLGVEPLSLDKWSNLDELLFKIKDPIARAFMPRYLTAAVARVYEPGCQARQLPVLVGPQNIGKTEAGRALFGEGNFADGLSNRLDVDDVTRLTRVWGLELGELDGITRRTQQEHFKAFISRRVDVVRRKYGRGDEDILRRSVFWGTSNGAPLRDPTGSTRFVCIHLPNNKLPINEIARLRDLIWMRAVHEYRKGFQWYSTEDEILAISERNSNYVQTDPWSELIMAYLDQQSIYPVPIELIYNRLEIKAEHQNNQNALRIRQICESHGWHYGQRRNEKGERCRGYWPNH